MLAKLLWLLNWIRTGGDYWNFISVISYGSHDCLFVKKNTAIHITRKKNIFGGVIVTAQHQPNMKLGWPPTWVEPTTTSTPTHYQRSFKGTSRQIRKLIFGMQSYSYSTRRVFSYVGRSKNFKRRFPKRNSTLSYMNANNTIQVFWRGKYEKLNPTATWNYLEPKCQTLTMLPKHAKCLPMKSSRFCSTQPWQPSSCRHRLPDIIGDPPD
jgi:hypothetical protein